MSRIPPHPSDPAIVIGDLVRRVSDLERVIQQLEGAVSPVDGTTVQAGMFASGSVGAADVGSGQIGIQHVSTLVGLGAPLTSQVPVGTSLVLAGGVSNPLALPSLALISTGGAASSIGAATYFLSYSWAHNDTSQAATVTVATPGVFTVASTAGWAAGDPIILSTTGALPTGLTPGVVYYVQSVVSATTFQLAATRTGAAIATSGTQSGTHTAAHYQETQPSPTASITVPNQTSYINVTAPSAPTGADLMFVYANTASFNAGGGHVQAGPIAASNATTTTVQLTAISLTSSASSSTNSFQSTATASGTKSGAKMFPGYPTDTSGNDYSWRLEGNGRARFLGPTLNCQFWWYSDFLESGGVAPADMQETASGTGSGLTIGTSTNANPGVANLNTGTTAAGLDLVRHGTPTIFAGLARIRVTAYCAVSSIANSTDKYGIGVGLMSAGTADSVDSVANPTIAFCLDQTGVLGSSTGNLGLRVTDGTGTVFQQALDANGANVTMKANVYHLLDFEINPAGTSIAWWVDGVPQTAVTTHIPTTGLRLQAAITKDAGTNSRALQMDALAIFGDYVS